MPARIAPLVAALLVAPLSAQTWQIVSFPSGFSPGHLAFDPTDVGHVVGFRPGALAQQIAETFDGGATWDFLDVPYSVAEFEFAEDIAFQHDGRLLVLGSVGDVVNGQILAVRRSAAGQWEAFGPRAPMGNFFAARAERFVSSASDVMAMTVTMTDDILFYSSVRVDVSTDGGATWEATTYPGGGVYDLELGRSLAGGERLFYSVGVNDAPGSAQYRYDVDDNITQVISSVRPAYAVSGRVARNTVYATPDENGPPQSLRRSDDGGETWSHFPMPVGTWSFLRGNVDADLIVRWPRFASGPRELSRDGGLTWNHLGGPVLEPDPLAFAPDDSRLFASLGPRYAWIDIHQQVGTVECTSAANASGFSAALGVLGSNSVAEGDLLLWTSRMLPGTFGMYIASQTAANQPGAGGSFGTLCLGGEIGRIGLPGLSGAVVGEFAYRLDLDAIPTPTGQTMIQPGQTWRFQTWFRDQLNGTPGSNFSDAVSVTFTL